MKILRVIAVIALLSAPLLAHRSEAQAAAAPAAMPACDGLMNIVRMSEITPTGSMDKFMAAVAAHQAWYKSHGLPDVIVAARVYQRDPQTKAYSYSDKEVLTFHYMKPDGPSPTHDAAWDAYVKLYNETSSIKESSLVCVPLAAAPSSLQ